MIKSLGPGYLGNKEIHLVLANLTRAVPEKGYLPAYFFQIRRCRDETLLGSCTLRVGETAAIAYSGHIGYAIAPEHRGNRYAAKALSLLLPLGFRCGLRQIVITCQPDNLASRRTCLLAGGAFEGIIPVPCWHEMYLTGREEVCRYLLCRRNIKIRQKKDRRLFEYW